MPHPDCYDLYIESWPTNDGGHIIGDPRLGGIIPELESEKIEIGSFPSVMADVLPDMYLDLSAVVAVWEDKHIAVARMHMFGVTETPVRKSKQAIEKMRTKSEILKPEDYFSWRTFLSGLTGIYTRDILDWCITKSKNGYFPKTHSFHGRAVRVTGCIIYIHSQTDR